MAVHKIGTYNMSFAGDAGLDPSRPGTFESEGAFHLSNKTGDRRAYWKNALKTVVAFVQESNASAIGLQEINLTAEGSITGSGAIDSAVTSAKPNFATKTYEYVVNPNVKPALTIVWNKTKLGEERASAISDLDYEPMENGGVSKQQKGRPIMFLLTDGGYLLINMHAPNHAELSKRNLTDLRRAIAAKTAEFMTGKGSIAKGKVFVMGDFNDRYDSLKEIRLDIAGTEHVLRYQGDAPYSCCHNWDSSCSEGRFRDVVPVGRNGGGRRIGTCDPQGRTLAGPGPREAMGPEGDIQNYRYTGDKVFGEMPVSDIAIYPFGRAGASKESDHEAVAADFTDGQGGGYRRRRMTRRKGSRSAHRKGSRSAHRRRSTRHKGSRRR